VGEIGLDVEEFGENLLVKESKNNGQCPRGGVKWGIWGGLCLS